MNPRSNAAPALAELPLTLYAGMWLAFWVVMFLLGLREYLRVGGHDMVSLAIRYGIAAIATTIIAVEQLLRASRQDHLLGRPALWFARFWRWLPVEALAFVAVMATVPSAVASLFGTSYEGDDWGDQAYNALMISFWCILCIMAAIGCATVTGPLVVGIVASKCAYACLFALGAIAALLLALENARTQSIICDKNCDLQFGPKPKPVPQPIA